MPIAAELRAALYNSAPWIALSRELRDERAGGRCECTGQCGKHHDGAPNTRCPHVDGAAGVEQRGVVRLGTAHWNQSESGLMVPRERLIVMCQGCHLRFDMESHLAARHANRMRKMARQYGQQDLFGEVQATHVH